VEVNLIQVGVTSQYLRAKTDEKQYKFSGSEVFTPVVMKSSIFWDTTQCRTLKVIGRVEEKYRLHF
jgi:hypothetical protein